MKFKLLLKLGLKLKVDLRCFLIKHISITCLQKCFYPFTFIQKLIRQIYIATSVKQCLSTQLETR